jgi:hypothetical protein
MRYEVRGLIAGNGGRAFELTVRQRADSGIGQLGGLCCVGRSRRAGDWLGGGVWLAFGVRWFPFPREVIAVAVHWYLRYGLRHIRV